MPSFFALSARLPWMLRQRFSPVMRAWNRVRGHGMVGWMPPPDRARMVRIRRETSHRKGEVDDENWRGLSADRTRR
jgi:hypothetical protein